MKSLPLTSPRIKSVIPRSRTEITQISSSIPIIFLPDAFVLSSKNHAEATKKIQFPSAPKCRMTAKSRTVMLVVAWVQSRM